MISVKQNVSEAWIEDFARDGFVTTPGVLTEAELNRYSAAVDAEVASRTQHDTRAVGDKSTYEQSFIQCMRLWETSTIIRELSCHPYLAKIASKLLGVDSVLLWQDQALYKEAGGRETTPHQDQPFWPIGDAPLISAWIPFDAIRKNNGAMAYVPASHKAGRLKVVDITHVTDPYEVLNDPALNGAQPTWVDVDPGSIVWHHGYTVHQASANQTQATRRVFTIVYIAANQTRVKDWHTFPLERAGVRVGETIEGDGLPVVWPPLQELPGAPQHLGEATGPQYKVSS